MHSKFPTLAAAVALALGSSVAGASSVDDIFSVRGYGTVGALYSSQDQADYVRDLYAQPEGVGHTHRISADVDSKTAVQVNAKFTDRFSAVVQIVSESMYNNSWDSDAQKMWFPSLEWANLSYRVTDDFTVRAGRIVMPFLMNAEFQKVGYANHWMRAPIELYGKVSYTSLDGGDAWYKHSLGSGTNTIRAYGGMQNAERNAPSPRAEIAGLIDTYEIGQLTLRAAYQYTTLAGSGESAATPFRQVAGGLSFLSAQAAAQANAIGDVIADGFKIKFATIGVSYDAGKWFAMGEVWNQTGSVLIPKHTSAYVSGGVRVGSWTPYATLARTDVDDYEDPINTAGLPTTGPLAPVVFGARAMNQSFSNSATYTQNSLSLGMRWDVMSSISVKAQYDYVALPSDSFGMFVNRQPGFKAGDDASLFGLSVDFVF